MMFPWHIDDLYLSSESYTNDGTTYSAHVSDRLMAMIRTDIGHLTPLNIATYRDGHLTPLNIATYRDGWSEEWSSRRIVRR